MTALTDAPIVYTSNTTAPLTRDYEVICEESRLLVDASDVAAWRIGDNAIEVMARFGERSLADYAREIGKPRGTVYEARQMAAMYSPRVRDEIAESCPNITRSHMRKVLFLHDADKARRAVEKASARGWTVDQFGYILKRYKALKGLGRATATRKWSETFEAERRININLTDEDFEKLDTILAAHPTAHVTVTVTWTEQAKSEA